MKTKNNLPELLAPATLQHFGMAALLPGMQYMIDQMEDLTNAMRAKLHAAQQQAVQELLANASDAVDTAASTLDKPKPKRGPGTSPAAGVAAYWAKMTPEERSKEVLRRQKVSEASAAARGKKRDNQKFNSWANVSAAERKRRIEAARATRGANLVAQAVNGAAHA